MLATNEIGIHVKTNFCGLGKISGNPSLFRECLCLSKQIQRILPDSLPDCQNDGCYLRSHLAHLGLQWRFPRLITSVLAQHTKEACTGSWLTWTHFSLGPWIKSLAIRQKNYTSLLSCKLENQLVKYLYRIHQFPAGCKKEMSTANVIPLLHVFSFNYDVFDIYMS